jgi:hypothetical protein
MDGRDLFLEQHAAMHSVAVGGNKMSAPSGPSPA